MASKKNGTLYIGVTSNLYRRVSEHKQGEVLGFTQKYKVNILVYYEQYTKITDAIVREKQMKNWKRQRKINQITSVNPDRKDVSCYL